MISMLFESGQEQSRFTPKEGDLFKNIETNGAVFEIRYGFYEECDRHINGAEPIPIYPNFLECPKYTSEGLPFVTEMQVPCEHFAGEDHADSGCGDCAFYRHGDELLGICTCPKKQNASPVKEVVQNE